MICPNCGKTLPDTAIICPYCGLRMNKKAPPPEPDQNKTQDGTTGGGAYVPPEPPKPQKTNYVPIVVAAVAVLAIVGGIIYATNGSSSIAQQPASSRGTQSTFSQSTQESTSTGTSASTSSNKAIVQETDGVLFTNIPAGATVTVDGQVVDRDAVDGDLYIPEWMFNTVSQVRVIEDSGSNYRTAYVWYDGDPDSVYRVDNSDYENSSSDGFNCPDDNFLARFAWEYYCGFLRAITNESMDDMLFATGTNLDEQSYYVHSTENQKNIWDIDSAHVTLDSSSVQFDNYGQSILMNVSYKANRTNRYTGETVLNENHRTIEMLWEDGTWKVNRIRFLSDADYASGRYADLS